MKNTLNRKKIKEPPIPPVVREDFDGDGDIKAQVLVYGEEQELVNRMVDPLKIWNNKECEGEYSVNGFVGLSDLDFRISRTIAKDPQKLLSLVYLVTRKNIHACLGSFLNLLDGISEIEYKTFKGFPFSGELLEEQRGEDFEWVSSMMRCLLLRENPLSVQGSLIEDPDRFLDYRKVLMKHDVIKRMEGIFPGVESLTFELYEDEFDSKQDFNDFKIREVVRGIQESMLMYRRVI